MGLENKGPEVLINNVCYNIEFRIQLSKEAQWQTDMAHPAQQQLTEKEPSNVSKTLKIVIGILTNKIC